MSQFSVRRLAEFSRRLLVRPERDRPVWRPDGWPAAAGTPIDPARIFSPDLALFESRIQLDKNDSANIRRVADNLIIYKNIPYFPYQGEWKFHPKSIGGYLTVNRISPELIATATNLLDYFVELPNGGLALYYPKATATERLQVNEPIYSAMSQAQLLAGYAKLARDCPAPPRPHPAWRDIAARLAAALTFPFEKGGVCVDGRMLLEAPNFRACPEIILNGWLDSLIHLYDYVCLFPNREMEDFFRRNLDALCELLPTFDHASARLSRYSNLCPYEFRIHFNAPVGGLSPCVTVEYLPADTRYGAYCIENLWFADATPRNCDYENKILKSRSTYMDVSLSASGLYDTRIRVAADCRRISFDPGSFSDSSTVPNRTWKTRSLLPESNYDGKLTEFRIRPSQHGLLGGCPTNFVKGGVNFYHVYHIVALYELALSTSVPEQKKTLIGYAARWYDCLVHSTHDRGRAAFADPDSFVKRFTRSRSRRHKYNFDELRRAAGG